MNEEIMQKHKSRKIIRQNNEFRGQLMNGHQHEMADSEFLLCWWQNLMAIARAMSS